MNLKTANQGVGEWVSDSDVAVSPSLWASGF
jgi:hypothetical protein